MRMSRHYHPAVHFKPTMESDDHASSHKLTTRSNSLCAREKQVQHRSLPTTFSIHHLTLYICILFFLSASVVHASSEKPTLLLFANRKDIRLMNAENVKNTTIFSNQLEEAAAVDFYYAEEIIFWTDIGLEMIKGLRLNGSTRNVFNVITNGIMSPDGLACDWLTKKLYWADSDTNRIEVCEFDGKNRKVLFWENLDMPRAIALVPQKGYMFWSDWGEMSKIERASMDGVSRETIVNSNIVWPNGLSADYAAERIYWADAKLEFIESMNYDGSARKTIVQGNLPHPFALTISGEHLYWTDWSSHSINVANKNSGRNRKTIVPAGLLPMDIHVYSAARQPPHPTGCDHNKGGCSHLCLLSSVYPEGYTCACPTGIRLLEDGKTCASRADKLLLLARRVDIRRISLDTLDHTDVVLPLKGIKHAIAIDYDVAEERIYWTDDDARLIRRAYLNGTNQEDLISSEVQHPDGIAIDWIARNMFWTDTGTDRIEVARLNGTSRKILIDEGLDQPRTIVLHPDKGYMYWTDWGEEAKIERAAMDGTMRHVIISNNLGWPNGLALDYETEKIYWCDAKTDKIEMASLTGQDRTTLVADQLAHPFGFTILDDYVYWTDWQRRSVERVHKTTGQGREVIIDLLPDVMGLRAVSNRVHEGSNPCGSENGYCTHLCLSKPNNDYTCACPTGYELAEDTRSCTQIEEYFHSSRRPDFSSKPRQQQPHRNPCQKNNGGCSHICLATGEGNRRKCSCPSGHYLLEDGKNCNEITTCKPDEFTCESGNVNCVPDSWRCDGVVECEDSSDEKNCPECSPPNYRCPRNGNCLEPSSFCDGHADCPDGADEKCCGLDEYMCGSPQGGCISIFQVCDGKSDCKGGMDEFKDSCRRKDALTEPLETPSVDPPQKTTYSYVIFGVLFVIAGVVSVLCVLTKKKSDLGATDLNMEARLPLNVTLDRRNFDINRDPSSTLGRRAPVGPGSSNCPVRAGSDQMYDRNNVTGASSTSSSSANPYPKETANPPPSPVTSNSHYGGGGSRSTSRSSRGGLGYPPRKKNHRRGPPPTPACSTDANDSDNYGSAYGRPPYYNNSRVDLNYDMEPYPPPPTPARSQYLSDGSTPPSPCTERSYNPYPPPPSPVPESGNEG